MCKNSLHLLSNPALKNNLLLLLLTDSAFVQALHKAIACLANDSSRGNWQLRFESLIHEALMDAPDTSLLQCIRTHMWTGVRFPKLENTDALVDDLKTLLRNLRNECEFVVVL